MAEGYLRHFGAEKIEVKSAGIEAHAVNPMAIATMKEDGIDISDHTSNLIDEYLNTEFDYIITVCDNANERCPVFPKNAVKLHRDFPDPAKATGTKTDIEESFRKTRRLIREYCIGFVQQYITK